jgi:hypothetical protein
MCAGVRGADGHSLRTHILFHFYIQQWTADDKRNCSICWKWINSSFGALQRHVQMDNLLGKMVHAFPSGPALSARAALITDRAQQQEARSSTTATTPANAPIAPPPPRFHTEHLRTNYILPRTVRQRVFRHKHSALTKLSNSL